MLGANKFRNVTPGTDQDRFRSITEGDFGECDMVFWSNVSNGYTDAQLAELNDPTKWERIDGGKLITVELYYYRRIGQ